MQGFRGCENPCMDIHDLDSIQDLDAREAFALAQGREDIVSAIDRLRREEHTERMARLDDEVDGQ